MVVVAFGRFFTFSFLCMCFFVYTGVVSRYGSFHFLIGESQLTTEIMCSGKRMKSVD